ncbi:IS30 family transposase, partial [Corynebacterium casei]
MPWSVSERGSNENTNGRLRRNLPKSSDLSQSTAESSETVADIYNHKTQENPGIETLPKS